MMTIGDGTLAVPNDDVRPFDPAEWLASFASWGGYWIVREGRLTAAGVYFDGNIEHEQQACAALTELKLSPARLAAVRAHLACGRAGRM